MNTVGIIANPASGKDIRRIVGNAITVDNQQKLSIVKRIIVALTASGVERILIMPEQFGFGKRALGDFANRDEVQRAVEILEMYVDGLPEETVQAAERMVEEGADCIIVLGGDGTSRLVASVAGDVPMLPISSGTNNVVPQFIEGTVAGLAAAHLSQQAEGLHDGMVWRHKRLVVKVNDEAVDHALVDVAVVDTPYVGSKAVWEPELVRQIFVTRADPGHIGISSIIGMAQIVDPRDRLGAFVRTGGAKTVRTTMLPGELVSVPIDEIQAMQPGESVPVISKRPIVLALDGEREVVLYEGDEASITLQTDGPWMVDVDAVLKHALEENKYTSLD